MKKYLWILLGLVVVGIAIWLFDRKVDNFYMSNIYLDSWPQKDYSILTTKLSAQEAKKILEQPFTYMNKGRQFYVFESRDGKYVLKLLKCQRMNTSDFYKRLPLPSFFDKARRKRLKEKQERTDTIFESCYLASTTLQPNTAVLYAHLTPKPDVKTNVTLIDGADFSHTFAIDEVPFVLQKRGQKVMPVLQQLIKKKDYDALDERLQQLVDLVIDDARLHVMDIDGGVIVRDNVAYLPKRAIHLDIGTFVRKKDTLNKPYLQACFERFEPLVKWLRSKDPQLADAFHVKMQDAIKEVMENDSN